MKFRTNKSKKTILNIVLIALSCILVFGLVFGIAKTVGDKDTKTIHPSFSVGSLTADGKYQESENQIYTKKAFECIGLNVALDFDAEITYQIFFYNYDGSFLVATPSLSEHYKDGAPLLATHARIVITPNEDEEIKFYEVGGYANQLSIKVDKVQGFDDEVVAQTCSLKVGLAFKNEYYAVEDNAVTLLGSENTGIVSFAFTANKSSLAYDFLILKVATSELTKTVEIDDLTTINTFGIFMQDYEANGPAGPYPSAVVEDYEILGQFEDFTYIRLLFPNTSFNYYFNVSSESVGSVVLWAHQAAGGSIEA